MSTLKTRPMKKLFIPVFLLCAIIVLNANPLFAVSKNKPIIGEWVYEVSDAPYGYEKGSMVFSEKEGQTVCVIKIEAGEMEATNLKIEKNRISFTALVEGNPVNVALTREKNKMSGSVDSPEGPKTITAVKKE